MNHLFKKISVIVVLLLLLQQSSLVVFAASISSVSASMQVHAGDVFVVDVVLNTEGSVINTVDGAVTLDAGGQLQVRDISVAGSDISLWPRKPSLSVSGDTVSFIGGIPGGSLSARVSLFKIILFAEKKGVVHVTPKVTAYLNDGKGTMVSIKPEVSNIEVLAPQTIPVDEWANTFKKDVVAPEPFVISQYQDSQLYGGKKFISFRTSDNESGVHYYEVTEQGRLPVRSGDQYVLSNPDGYQTVSVSAVDYAGNIRTITQHVGDRPFGWGTVILGVLLVCFFIKRKIIWSSIKSYVSKKNS